MVDSASNQLKSDVNSVHGSDPVSYVVPCDEMRKEMAAVWGDEVDLAPFHLSCMTWEARAPIRPPSRTSRTVRLFSFDVSTDCDHIRWWLFQTCRFLNFLVFLFCFPFKRALVGINVQTTILPKYESAVSVNMSILLQSWCGLSKWCCRTDLSN